jgi:hypothetical protein
MKKFFAPLALLLLSLSAFAQQSSKPIQDNSFLLEEAYNQERGVIQHINAFQRLRGGNWIYTFTEEWPVKSQRHQLSITLPVQRIASNNGLGDIALNYRYQLMGSGDARVAIAPRASLLFPTGDEKKELGSGGAGLQFNLPISAMIHPRIVTHINAGTTLTPSAKNAQGVKDNKTDFNLGQSFIWLAHQNFNVMFETVWNSFESIESRGVKSRQSSLFINPGFRWAHNFKNGLQIVPGIAFPLGIGSSNGQRGVFLYISFEHPLGKQGK